MALGDVFGWGWGPGRQEQQSGWPGLGLGPPGGPCQAASSRRGCCGERPASSALTPVCPFADAGSPWIPRQSWSSGPTWSPSREGKKDPQIGHPPKSRASQLPSPCLTPLFRETPQRLPALLRASLQGTPNLQPRMTSSTPSGTDISWGRAGPSWQLAALQCQPASPPLVGSLIGSLLLSRQPSPQGNRR